MTKYKSYMEFKSTDMKALLILIILSYSVSLKAQTWDEILKQKETQKKYLIQQLAALKLYAGYLKKGYDIADKGISSIKALSNGELKLHDKFFKSLKLINPSIAKNARLAEILKWQYDIRRGLNTLRQSSGFPLNEKTYFESVRNNIVDECAADLDELLLIITSGELEMQDDERIKRIESIHSRMKDKYVFTQSFISQANNLRMQREIETRSINRSKSLNQIPN